MLHLHVHGHTRQEAGALSGSVAIIYGTRINWAHVPRSINLNSWPHVATLRWVGHPVCLKLHTGKEDLVGRAQEKLRYSNVVTHFIIMEQLFNLLSTETTRMMHPAPWRADRVKIANGSAGRCSFDLLRYTEVDTGETPVRCILTIRGDILPSHKVLRE